MAVGCTNANIQINLSSQSASNSMTVSDVTTNEYGLATVRVQFSKIPSQDVTLSYRTIADTAIANQDFLPITSAQYTVPAGSSFVDVPVSILNNFLNTGVRQFLFEIFSSTDPSYSNSKSKIQINDDDGLPLSGVSAISSGDLHSCVTIADKISCWGSNSFGQLGTGDVLNRPRPAQIASLSNITAVSSGGGHTCALQASGVVFCWGYNASGQLGIGNVTNQYTPTAIGIVTDFTSISVGTLHTCGINTAGNAYCWGYNIQGRVGDGTVTNKNIPISVITGNALQIAAGDTNTCVVLTDNSVKCWGDRTNGAIGDNGLMTGSQTTPVAISGGFNFQQISLGASHACGVTTTGGVKCWGWNANGQLGDNSTTNRKTPVNASGLVSGVLKVEAGGSSTCALLNTGAVKCWGSNISGQLGDGTKTDRLTPVDVIGLSAQASSISVGYGHACAQLVTNQLQCWGYNTNQQIGDGYLGYVNKPTNVTGMANGALHGSAGSKHACIVDSSGALNCWGYNNVGQLGDGTTVNRSTPVVVIGSNVKKVALGSNHSCALKQDESVWCWGNNFYGNLGVGDNTDRFSPTQVSGLGAGSGVKEISAGDQHSCALFGNGTIKCWGGDGSGQLGDDGSLLDRYTPTTVFGISSASHIASGFAYNCAITNNSSQIHCWGLNDYGQIGDGTYTLQPTPVQVLNLSGLNMNDISLGRQHSCTITNVGVKCWGDNSVGQLGDNSTTTRLIPTDVVGLPSSISQIELGDNHSCASSNNGALYCWGDNSKGQVGSSSAIELTAQPVPGLSLGVLGFISGDYFSCAALKTNDVKCWGLNDYNQLGFNYSNSIPQFTLAP